MTERRGHPPAAWLTRRGEVEIKAKASMTTYLLLGRRDAVPEDSAASMQASPPAR